MIYAGIVTIIGLLAYALSTNPKIQRLGELSFFAGLLALLFAVCTVVGKQLY